MGEKWICHFNVLQKQRESTATIKAAPAAYVYTSPPKGQNVIEFDCRGLEFVDFKADVT